MEAIDFREYLNVLTSPAFILDFETPPASDNPSSFKPAFYNRVCEEDTFSESVRREIEENVDFRQWLSSPHLDDSSQRGQQDFETGTLSWASTFLRNRWKVVTSRPRKDAQQETPSLARPLSRRIPSWTNAWSRNPPQTDVGEHRQHLEYLLGKDWSSTPMGALTDWPQSLRTMSSYVLNCPFPCALYWGEDLAILYNYAYIAIAQSKHPRILGMAWREAWPELWAEDLGIKQRLLLGLTDCEPTRQENDLLFLDRGLIDKEETYMDWYTIPFPREPGDGEEIRGTVGPVRIADKGIAGGLVNPVFEITQRTITERRLRLLREMGQRVTSARATAEYWNIVISALEAGPYDIPGCVVYGVQEPGATVLGVVGQTGLDQGHAFFPQSLDLGHLSQSGFEGYVGRALSGGNVLVTGEEVLSAFHRRGWCDEPRRAVVALITPSANRGPQGVLFLVLSSRRPYDENYSLFVELLTRQIGTSLTNVQLLEEEIRRTREIAETHRLNRLQLERALEQRTKELHASEGFMGRLAEICPVGIVVSDGTGRVTFVNETWYRITAYPHNLDPSDWISHVHPDDVDSVADAWRRVLQGLSQISREFRWLRPLDEGYSSAEDVVPWCSMAVAPEMDGEGNVVRIFGAFTDISDRKRAEREQHQRLEEAVELRRQQESFIDMTSHEMRNPLSAILQSSDTVLQCLMRVKNRVAAELISPEIDDALEAIHIVMLCSNHQKRIMDDTLTMSKLDSRLLLVTPVDCQPVKVVEKVMRMFENDFAHKEIQAQLVVHPSLYGLHIDWVKADPSRFTQVLVNLLTNAIKFTAEKSVRQITVTVGPVSSTRPDLDNQPRQISSPSVSPPTEKDILFLTFSVRDTGRGLSDSQRALLFQRFTQASPETHVNYGGSGLGLFICRKLTELQGGQITVQSREGEGSTFSFYIETKRANPPPPELGGDQDPTTAAATELTNSRTEASFLQSSEFVHGEGSRALQQMVRRNTITGKPSYSILVVEDNQVNQQVLAKQLQLAGCTTVMANNGLEALQIITTSTFARDAPPGAKEFDVCLLDIEMPIMDGITACHRLRELEQSGHIITHVPIIAVTANARQEQIDRMLQEGFDDVLTKPFRVPNLLSTVETLLRKNVQKD